MVTQVGLSVAVYFILVHLVTQICYCVTFQNRPCVANATFCTSGLVVLLKQQGLTLILVAFEKDFDGYGVI